MAINVPGNPPPKPIVNQPPPTNPPPVPGTNTPTGDDGGVKPQPEKPAPPPIQHTGDDGPDINTGFHLADLSASADPELLLGTSGGADGPESGTAAAGINVVNAQLAQAAAENATQPTPPPPPPQHLTEDPDAGGEIFHRADTLQLAEDPDAGGEIAKRTTVGDAHDRFASIDGEASHPDHDKGGQENDRLPVTRHLSDDPDGGGEVDGSGGGPVAMDGIHLLASVSSLQADAAEDVPTPPPPPPPPPQHLTEDPDAGGEIFHRADTLQLAEDPDAGGEIDGGFGTGASSAGATTMTAGDLGVVDDPDGGDEVFDDPDGGDEIGRADQTVDDEPMGFATFDTGDGFDLVDEPELDLTDAEPANTIDQATHTFEPE